MERFTESLKAIRLRGRSRGVRRARVYAIDVGAKYLGVPALLSGSDRWRLGRWLDLQSGFGVERQCFLNSDFARRTRDLISDSAPGIFKVFSVEDNFFGLGIDGIDVFRKNGSAIDPATLELIQVSPDQEHDPARFVPLFGFRGVPGSEGDKYNWARQINDMTRFWGQIERSIEEWSRTQLQHEGDLAQAPVWNIFEVTPVDKFLTAAFMIAYFEALSDAVGHGQTVPEFMHRFNNAIVDELASWTSDAPSHVVGVLDWLESGLMNLHRHRSAEVDGVVRYYTRFLLISAWTSGSASTSVDPIVEDLMRQIGRYRKRLGLPPSEIPAHNRDPTLCSLLLRP